MKVIHLISGGDSGGAKTHVLSLLQNLNKTITAQMVCFRDGPFAEEARRMGIPTEIMGGNNIPRLRRQLTAYIKAGGYQIIHCHGSRANMVGALLRKSTGLPVVSTVHSDYKLDYMGRPLSHITFGNINAWALHQLDYRIGVSDAMVDLLISRGFAPDRFFAIYNGIDFTPAPDQGDRLPYLRSLGADVDENSVVVGIAARLNPVKDMSTLVRGFAAGYQKCPRLRLVIAGDGEERQKLESLAKELGVEQQVTFAGWISGGMDRFYSALDINALTSLSETFPYALTEGARFHLATVATAVGGIPYLIDQDVNGYLFQPGDWETLGGYLAAIGNDDQLRHQLGEKLYEKASTKYSIQKTVDTQLHIYSEIIRRHNRPAKVRDGVVICGAYGRGNVGDDAILEAILQEMRSIDPDMPVTVLSKDPQRTRLTYRVRAISRTAFFSWFRAMKHAKLYINGGGSLIQDVTSSRSLWYYLLSIATAKRLGNRVLMYGCGIGPVSGKRNRRMAGRVIDRNADIVTLREDLSRDELTAMGVTRPEMMITADPAILLQPAPEEKVCGVLASLGVAAAEPFFLVALRPWKGMAERLDVITAAVRKIAEKQALRPLFLAMEPDMDLSICRQAADACGALCISAPADSTVLVGILRQAKLVVSMRLHALIFGAGVGTPLVGLSYDPKVAGFMRYIGQDRCLPLDAVTEESLLAASDAALDADFDGAAQAARLRLLAVENREAARRLLED